MRRSAHVIYTILADVEAQIFADADQAEAIASAASLDVVTAQVVVNDLGHWRRDLADSWRPWIEECCVAEAVRARCWVGFGALASRVHTGRRHRTLDGAALAAARMVVAATSLFTGAEYTARRNKVMLKLDRVYSAGRQASLLKGKWLPAQLTFAVSDYFDRNGWHDGWNRTSFKESVTRCYMANLNMSARDLVAIRTSLEALI